MINTLDIDFDNLDNPNNWEEPNTTHNINKVQSHDLSHITSLLDFFLINGRLPLQIQLQEKEYNK